MEDAKEHHHIVMLPFTAQGHLIPFLALANQIHQNFGFKITIATTPLNILYLSSTIANNSTIPSPKINLHQLPFNSSDHNLPPNTENTESLPLNQIVNLFHATTSLESPFRALISDISIEDGRPPLCIISDVFTGWANDVAKSCNTVNVTFTTGGAYGTAAYVSLWQHLPHNSTNKDEFTLPGFPDSCTFHITQLHPFLRAANVEEIEPFGLDVFRNYTKLPVWCIGPLLPPIMLSGKKTSRVIGRHTGKEPGVSPEQCIEWLECNPERSVLYISFGSQNTISSSQMMELAMGLEDSKRAFIWAIRPPVGFNSKSEFKSEWLPKGFEERMANTKQGLIIHKWAPQLEILCHKSTGAFLSHCGWNSTMESLSQGVPIIGWPLAAEQGYNSKMLMEEMGVCVELTRGVQSSISRDGVKKVIEMVMGEGSKGEEMKKKAGEIGELIRGAVIEEGSHKGSSLKAMDEFVNALLSNIQ
ncbi:hypothetical protein ACJIZ3_018056 [Penstemon smallii]|uniref:Glycosyltransferase n=1 Tax=Penstemon smallii TaxID=265156 RepID=A0ABD3SXA5_9LAMI